MSYCRSSSTSVDSFNLVASSPLIGQGDQEGTLSSTQKGACKQFALRLSLFFITWPAAARRPRPSLAAAAAQITVSTNVRRCDDFAGKQRNELCSLCWKCRLLDPSIRSALFPKSRLIG